MLIYILITILILLFRGMLVTINTPDYYRKKERQYSIVLYAILIFISAVRSQTVGADTPGYVSEYINIHQYNFQDLLVEYKDFEGFYILAWICKLLHFPVQLWLGIVATLYIVPVAALINKYSTDKLYSIMCFFLMGAFTFSLAGLKQSVAMGMSIMAYLCIIEKRYLYTILFGIFAFLCHKTSIIFLFAFPIYYLRNNRYFYAIVISMSALILVYHRELLIYMTETINDQRYMAYLNSSRSYSAVTLIYYLLMLSMPFLLSYKNNSRFLNSNKVLFGMSAMCTSFQSFAFVSPSAFRLALYFLPFFGIYIPNILVGRYSNFIKVGIMLMLIFYFFYTGRHSQYHFFWEM